MANDVKNEFKIYGSQSGSELHTGVRGLIEGMSTRDLKEVLWGTAPSPKGFDGRTKFSDEYGLDFAFRSAWGACDEVQDQICLILSRIDPKVIVVNEIEEECFSPIACRIVTIDEGVVSFYSEVDITDEIDGLDEELSALEESDQPDRAAIKLIESRRDALIEEAHEKVAAESWQELYADLPSLKTSRPIFGA